MNGFAALDIPPCRRYVVVKATAGFAVCRLILKLLLFYSCLDFTQNLGKTRCEIFLQSIFTPSGLVRLFLIKNSFAAIFSSLLIVTPILQGWNLSADIISTNIRGYSSEFVFSFSLIKSIWRFFL